MLSKVAFLGDRKRFGAFFLFLSGLLLTFGTAASYSQGGSISSGGILVLGPTGRPIGGALVTVCAFGAAGIPCSPTITVYTSSTLTTPATNPATSDGNGNVFVYAAPGSYTYTVTGTGIIGSSFTATVAGSGGGDALLNGNNTFTAQQNFDADVLFKGPNPYADVRRYGVRAIVTAAIPAIAGITANISSGSAIATISNGNNCAAQTGFVCFVNGDGVTIYGAGATNTMTTPAAPTVTPQLAAAMTGTGLNVNGPAGATTYNYKIFARDIGGGFTASSAAGSTATGAASLGSTSVSITSASRATNVVTVTTASAHGLITGSMVRIFGMSDSSFNGTFSVSGSADNTHFTFISGMDVQGGATLSATGGTVTWFACNHVSWTATTGALEYFVYSDRQASGTFALIGKSKPKNPFFVALTDGSLYFDDFGETMMSGFTAFPSSIPTTAPSVATNDYLTTTIISGAGTTTLTLAASAINTVAGATILYDAAPNIKAAAVASGTLPLYFGFFQDSPINSILDLRLNSDGLIGPIGPINETLILGPNHKWRGDVFPMAGSGSSFQFQPNPTISCNTSPCVWAANNGVTYIGNIQFNPKGNGQLLMLLDAGGGGPLYTLENVYFGSPGSGNEKMDMNLLCRQSNDNGASCGASLIRVNFNSAQTLSTDSYTPTAYFQGGYVRASNLFLSGRGLLCSGCAGFFDFDWMYTQGSATPFVTVAGPGITGQFSATPVFLNHVVMDTTSGGVLGNLPTSFGGSGASAVLADLQGNSLPTTTGNPFVLVIGGSLGSQNNAAISGSNFTNNTVQVNSALGGIGFALPVPAAPISAVVSAGGSVPLGAHNYSVVWTDANAISLGNSFPVRGTTVQGPTISATATTGNQTVTVTPPAPAPGVAGVMFLRDGLLQGPSSGNCGPFSPNSTLVDTLGFSACAQTGPLNTTAFSSGATSVGNETQQLNITGGGFKSTLSGTFTANRAQGFPDISGTVGMLDSSNGSLQPTGAWQCTNVTPVTVNANVTTDQNLMACTVPAGTLNRVGRSLRIHVKGVYTTPAAATPQITLKIKLCSVSGCGSGNVSTLVSIQSTATLASVTNNQLLLDVYSTTQTGGAASRFETSGVFAVDLGALTSTADSIFADTNTSTIAGTPADIDITAQNFLQVTLTFSTNQASANSATERQLVVESVN